MFSKEKFIVFMLTLLLGICFAVPAMADCTSIIVGKEASKTGEVLLGHNEDNGGQLVMVQYIVPRMKHKPGEKIVLEDSAAIIPQVEETWKYLWSETRSATGASFSDFFINEWGVAVTSDNCGPSRETNPELKDGGIGYGLRRIIAERAKTAREGVKIATKLLDEYGYIAPGRSYQIVDKNEGWMLQVVNGKHYVAQRVQDDEIAVIPNHYTIRDVDPEDTENFIMSKDLIAYAINQGWYLPKSSNYKDFDFAKAYQNPDGYAKSYNVLRHKHGLEILLGKKLDPEKDLPFAVKPTKKIGIEDVKAALRTHYEGTEDDLTYGYKTSPHYTENRVICTSTTQESFVLQFREDPNFTVIWRATGRPCVSPYVPWYLGNLEVPEGYGWIDENTGMKTHFKPSSDDLSYNKDRTWWKFKDMQNFVDFRYGLVIDTVRDKISNMERKWHEDQKDIESKALNLYEEDANMALQFLTDYTNKQAEKASEMALDLTCKLDTVKIKVDKEDIKKDDKDKYISVTILSDDKFDATKIDPLTATLGPGFAKPENRVRGSKMRYQDVNKNGKKDMVITFEVGKLIENITPSKTDLWILGKTMDDEPFAARTVINILE